jgi:demethylsterigmatocystin 6-O-methyltransferase
MIKTGFDLGLFKLLSGRKEPTSTEEIAKLNGGDPALISRILRFLASIRVIQEVGQGIFEANKTTRHLADPGVEGGLKYM